MRQGVYFRVSWHKLRHKFNLIMTNRCVSIRALTHLVCFNSMVITMYERKLGNDIILERLMDEVLAEFDKMPEAEQVENMDRAVDLIAAIDKMRGEDHVVH